ncbi:MAG: DUF1415 family protein [Polyangiaceae bacterium]|nr:DUF1415 family protein [Polyangiaceae bacterium]MCW5790627.1 DUF1415 family protein [Polyangiaceae bacterium]
MDDDALIREALRVYRRYQLEVVEGLDLCPWAERARREGRVSERVLLQPHSALEPSLAAIQELAAAPELEIGLLIYPRLTLDYAEFDRFVAAIRQGDEQNWPLGEVPFAAATFHPGAVRSGEEPERLVPSIRRSPDPTIQLVRRSVLERMRQGPAEGTHFIDLQSFSFEQLPRPDQRPLRERVARANAETLKRVGLPAFDRIIADIRRDRDESYARLGEAASPWS